LRRPKLKPRSLQKSRRSSKRSLQSNRPKSRLKEKPTRRSSKKPRRTKICKLNRSKSYSKIWRNKDRKWLRKRLNYKLN